MSSLPDPSSAPPRPFAPPHPRLISASSNRANYGDENVSNAIGMTAPHSGGGCQRPPVAPLATCPLQTSSIDEFQMSSNHPKLKEELDMPSQHPLTLLQPTEGQAQIQQACIITKSDNLEASRTEHYELEMSSSSVTFNDLNVASYQVQQEETQIEAGRPLRRLRDWSPPPRQLRLIRWLVGELPDTNSNRAVAVWARNHKTQTGHFPIASG